MDVDCLLCGPGLVQRLARSHGHGLLAEAALDGFGCELYGLSEIAGSRSWVIPDDVAYGGLGLEATPPLASLFYALGVAILLVDVELSDRELDDVLERRSKSSATNREVEPPGLGGLAGVGTKKADCRGLCVELHVR